jgi:endonuclease/exonuclease/phosphatase family metal-dependent hydrolase
MRSTQRLRKQSVAVSQRTLITVLALATITATGTSFGFAQQQNVSTVIEVRVMSFNIRNGRANDGENSWKHRKEFVADVIRDTHPDVVGLQEAFRFQLDVLREQLPEFHEVGEGRDGDQQGEYSAILYRSSRFTAEDSGTFWLSDTPEVKSRHWGNRYLRICSWARLKEISTGKFFYIYNTHFDHQSQNARLKSAQLIAQRIQQRQHTEPFVLTGDFNAGEDNPVVLYLKGRETTLPRSPITTLDTFRKLHPKEKAAGTGGGFEGRREGNKIDYIFVPTETEVMEAAIVRTKRDGRYPSDHFPVTAQIRLQAD